MNNLRQQIEDIVGKNGISTASHYFADYRAILPPVKTLAIKPSSAEQVSKLMLLAQREGFSFIPQGGNTGLVGGSVPQLQNQLVLSSHNLTKIHRITGERVIAGSGCSLQTIQQQAAKHSAMLPIGIVSKCSLGGLVATNAGGANVVGFGTTGELVMGLEVVTADGNIHSSLARPFKDNYGYRWHNWFIGSEGTLGFITAVDMRLYPLPKQRVAVLFEALEPLSQLSQSLVEQFGSSIMALEYMSESAMRLGLEYNGFKIANPKPSILLEIASPFREPPLKPYVISSLTKLGIKNPITEPRLWQLRGSLSDAGKAKGFALKHDISIPKHRLEEFLDEAPKLVPQHWEIICFGHLGDGSLHYNIHPPAKTEQKWSERIYELVVKLGGSIAAEHGTGRYYDLAKYKSPNEYELMKSLKQSLDPNNILGKGVLWQDI